MSAIFYKNLPYGAGGSNVEANPSGSATGDLTKVGIDGTVYDVTDADAVHNADKGVANGVASLDANGAVPTTQIPTAYLTGDSAETDIQDADYFPFYDTSATAKKKSLWSNIKAKLKAYFDTLYDKTPTLATVATSGSYNDLTNKPTIPSGQIQSDWNQTDSAQVDFIKNKPDIDLEGSKTATGNPITLTDASESYAEELEVTLEPIQDLHGYDKPWVGGAGKNKLINYAETSGIFTVYSDGTIKAQGTTSSSYATLTLRQSAQQVSDWANSLEDGNYILSAGLSGFDNTDIGLFIGDLSLAVPYVAAGERQYSKAEIVAAVNANANIRLFVAANKTVNVLFKPMLRKASEQDSSYAPYSNICPITGYTEVNVGSVGKNRLPINYGTITNYGVTVTCSSEGADIDGTSDATRSFKITNEFTLPVGNYVLNGCPSGGGYGKYSLEIGSRPIGGGSYASVALDTGNGASFTADAEHTYSVSIYVYSQYGRYNHLKMYPMIRVSTDTAIYEPYKSSSTNTSLGRTVYGGKLNVTGGGTESELAYTTINDLSLTRNPDNGLFYVTLSDAKPPASNNDLAGMFSSCYGEVVYNRISLDDGSIALSTAKLFVIKDTRYTSVTDLKNAMGTQQICYVKATPTHIATPPTDLKLLDGINTITTNGTIISLKYQPNNPLGDILQSAEEYTDRAIAKDRDEWLTVKDSSNVISVFHNITITGSVSWTRTLISKLSDYRFMYIEVTNTDYNYLALNEIVLVDTLLSGTYYNKQFSIYGDDGTITVYLYGSGQIVIGASVPSSVNSVKVSIKLIA